MKGIQKEKEGQEPKKRRERWRSWDWKKTAIVVAVLIFVSIFAREGIVGYAVYQEVERSGHTLETYTQNIDQLKTDLGIATTNLSLYSGVLEETQEKLYDTFQLYTLCLEDKSDIKGELQTCTATSSGLESDLAQAESSANEKAQAQVQAAQDAHALCLTTIDEKDQAMLEAQTNYDELVANTARSMCCKQKVDSPSIDSYDVVSNKVVCLEGGEKLLEC